MDRKSLHRITALMLSIIMAIGVVPVSVVAETGGVPSGASSLITGIEAFVADIAKQRVSIATTEDELNLPNILNVTVLSASDELPNPDETAMQSNLEADEEESAPDGETNTEEAPKTEESTEKPSSVESVADGAVKPMEVTTQIPVVWTSSPPYNGEMVGEYIFTPVIPEEYSFLDNVEIPKITVTVVQDKACIVTSFNELSEEIRWQNTREPVFPESLEGTIDGQVLEIPVTWQTDQDYEAESPESGLYVFFAEPQGEYVLSENLEVPRITLFVPARTDLLRAGGDHMGILRVGGQGTESSPIEITTAHQLREIALLVNNWKLETFLLNNPSAKVYLKLMNDIDLSAYGETFNDGRGWEPIGYGTYTYLALGPTFKGNFDGCGHQISGLYIKHKKYEEETRPNYLSRGLFGCIEGVVENLIINDARIVGKTQLGIIAGKIAPSATVRNCSASGTIDGHSAVGGIGGHNNGLIENCSVNAIIGSPEAIGVGGIAGFAGGGIIRNCYALGTVSGGDNVGGILGSMAEATEVVEYCAALQSKVIGPGTNEVGRILGHKYHSAGYSIAYANMECAGVKDGVSKTADDLQNVDAYPNTLAKAPWTYEPGKLPGLFGKAAAMPTYINPSQGPLEGSGTAAEPYLVSTAEQLHWVANQINSGKTAYRSAYYKLTNDIDLSNFKNGIGWTPIGEASNPFKGDFNGNGFTITGLYIYIGEYNYQHKHLGLFGVVDSGKIYNLGITDINIQSKVGNVEGIGGVAGDIKQGTVKNCFTTGTISGNSYLGGIVGSFSGRLENCYSTAVVSGTYQMVGGVAGIVVGSMVGCYATGAVSAAKEVGGLAGRLISIGEIKNSVALNPSVTATDMNAGRVVGYIFSGGSCSGNIAFSGMVVKIKDVVQSITDGTESYNGQDKSADQLKTAAGFPNALTSTPWHYFAGALPLLKDDQGNLLRAQDGTLPTYIGIGANFIAGDGSEENPYLISSHYQLAQLAKLINSGIGEYYKKHYRLIDDIDLSMYRNNGGWTPIGNGTYSFAGSFDGNGKVVSNLFIDRVGQSNQGLFGSIDNAVIRNLGITKANILASQYVGGLFGMASRSLIQNCYVSGIIEARSLYGGGIVGYIGVNSLVESCYTDCLVKSLRHVGGIAGAIVNSTIENCYTLGLVGKTDSGAYHNNSGGLAGTANNATISNCYVANSVEGDMVVGGVVGNAMSSTVQKCLMLGNSVKGIQDVKRISASGGILSDNYTFSGTSGGGGGNSPTHQDGADLTIQQILDSDFWQSNLAYSALYWEFPDGKLPILKNVGGAQYGDGSFYIIRRDISKAGISLISNQYIYSGSLIQPNIEVTFDGDKLKKNVDYIISVEPDGDSNGINAGTVLAKIEGIGNFKGTKSFNYTIEKATPTIEHLQYDLTPVTYNGLGQKAAVSMKSGFSGMGAFTVKYNGITDIPVNAGDYVVRVQIGNGSNFNSTTTDIELGTFTINKAPGVFGSPASVSATYSTTLKLGSITLPAGYVWSNPTIALNAGNGQSFEAIFNHPSGNFKSVTGAITVNIAKAKGDFVSPAPSSATYSPTLKLEDISLPKEYVWLDPTISLNAGNGQSFEAIYTHPSGNYESVAGMIVVNVAKAITDFIPPDPISLTYSPTLKLRDLTLPDNYVWKNPEAKLNAGDNQSHQAIYNHPSGNYEAFGSITVNVAKAEGTFGHYPVRATYSPTLKLRDIVLRPNFSWVYPDTPLKAGNFFGEAIYIDPDGNYLPATGTVWVIIDKATPSLKLTANPSATQTRPGSVELSAIIPEDATGTLTFKAGSNTIATATLPNKTAIFTPTTEVNTYSFTVVYSGDSNYNSVTSGKIDYSFIKSDQMLSALDGTVHYGSRLDLLTLVSGGYGTGAVSFDVTDGPGEVDGTMLIPKGVGEVLITVTKAADYDYNAKSVSFKVLVQPRIVELSIAPVVVQTYTGTTITPEPEVTDGSTVLIKGKDFIYEYNSNTDVGISAIVKVIGVGNYAGSFGSTTFTIGNAVPKIITPPIVKGKAYTSQKLLQIPLSDGVASVNGRFEWVDPSATVLLGENTFEARFIPADPVLYTQVAGIHVIFTAEYPPSSSYSESKSYTTGVVASGNLYSSIDVFVLSPRRTGKANEVVDSITYYQLHESLESGFTPIIAYEVRASSYSGKLTLSFPVGQQYDGMEFEVKHKTTDGTINTYTGVVENGKVVIVVDRLSPFMIGIKGIGKNPYTGR